MTEFLKERNVSFLGKDFQGFKKDLIKFSQAHHSGVFQDFNEASPGMAVLELQAYIGDVLSFYLDRNFDELRDSTARQVSNVVANARVRGYVPAGKRSAGGTQEFAIEVPATTRNGELVPDDLYTPIMRRGAQLGGPNGVTFETLDDIVFSASSPSDPRMVTGSRFDDTTGLPTFFAVRKSVPIVAGETKTFSIDVTEFQRFLSIELPDPDVIEILSVSDSDGNDWFEVEYLAQDSVFEAMVNETDDVGTVPYVLKMKTVPRRFIKERNPLTNKTSVIFGSGDGVNFDDELVPNIADLSLPLAGRRTFTSFALDPQNLLRTRSLGLSPFNTSLTFTYRVGGGAQTNVPAGSIKTVNEAVLDFSTTTLDPLKKSAVVKSLESWNTVKTDGGGPEESIGEIKANAAAFFAAQSRVVTRADVISRVYSLPGKFGKPAKVFVKPNANSSFSFDIHILSKDSDGHLTQATTTLKQNIAMYMSKYRMLTDGVNLLQSDIINIGIDFGIVVSPKFIRQEVLAKCLNEIGNYFDIDKWQIGQPIIISDLISQIQAILGVVSVYKLDFRNIIGAQDSGLTYSLTHFDVHESTENGILYCPENSIFEVKFPHKDVTGEAK